MAEKIQLTISGLLQDLKDGLTRDDIAVKYNLNKTQVKNVFQHPKLKNRKTIKPKDAAFVLTDDTEASEVVVLEQLELDLTANPDTAEESNVNPPEVTPVEDVPVEPVDAYTQNGIELTDDTAEVAPEVVEVPATTTTEGVW